MRMPVANNVGDRIIVRFAVNVLDVLDVMATSARSLEFVKSCSLQ